MIQRGQDTGKLKFYRFPRDVSLLSKWKTALKIKKIGKSDRICSVHFSDSDFRATNLGWKVLLPSAVPSLSCLESVIYDPKDSISIKVEAEESSGNDVAGFEKSISDNTVAAEEGCNNYLNGTTDEESNESVASTLFISPDSKNCNSQEDLFPCTNCNKRFSSRLLLLLHLSTHFESKRKEHICECSELKIVKANCPPFFCAPCGLTFNSRSLLERHRAAVRHSLKYCATCDLAFGTEAILESHVTLCHFADKHVCFACDRLFATCEKWVSHEVDHAAAYECPECCEQFEGFVQLQAHFKCHKKLVFWSCNFCHMLFSSLKAINAHLKKEQTNRVAQCYFCSEGFLPGDLHNFTYHSHMLRFNPDFSSKRNLACLEEQGLEEPTKKKPCIDERPSHRAESDGQIKVVSVFSKGQNEKSCSYLSRSPIKQEISQDDGMISDALSAKECPKNESPETFYLGNDLKCEDCNKVNGNYIEMKLHQELHKSRGDFSCIECGKQCHSSLSLGEHYRNHVLFDTEDKASFKGGL